MYKISVIIPVFNSSLYLDHCLSTVVNQTLMDIEIILIDDGSTDDSLNVIKNYAKKYNNIKYTSKENEGQAIARNIGIQMSSGEFITFIDSDDYVSTNHIEHLYNIIITSQADMAIEWGQTFYEGAIPIIDTLDGKKEVILNPNEALANMFYQKDFDTNAWAKLYKRSLFEGIRYPKGWLYEDLPTTYRLIQRCKKVVFSDYKSYYYLLRSNSIEGAPFKIQKYESCIKIIQQLEQDRTNMSVSVQKALDCRIVSFAFHILLEVPNTQNNIRNNLLNIIKDKRKSALFNNNARKKVRIACMLTYIGMWAIDILAKYGKSR